MCTLAIIGGSLEATIQKYAKKQDITILFHNGKMSQHSAKYRAMIRKADVVAIIPSVLNHNSMESARRIAKELGKPIVYPKSRGIAMVIYMSLSEYEKIKNK